MLGEQRSVRCKCEMSFPLFRAHSEGTAASTGEQKDDA